VSQRRVLIQDFFGHRFGIAHGKVSAQAARGIVLVAGHGWPAAFFADLAHDGSNRWEGLLECGLCRVRNEAVRVDADLETRKVMSSLRRNFPVQVDQWFETHRFAPDDGERQWQPEHRGPHHGFRRATDRHPDR
jgi:hypothetical protein